MANFKLVYDEDREEIIDGIEKMKDYFKKKQVKIGICESIKNNTHFVSIYCDNKNLKKKDFKIFNMYIGDILYKILINEFFDKYINGFIDDTYFFLGEDEINEIKYKSINVLMNDNICIDQTNIYYINRKNNILKEIMDCINENEEINIKGFMTFRMKELKKQIEDIIDKIVENYMVEKEYSEFVKLLKYFVDIQESKMEQIHITINESGKYEVKNEEKEDVLDKLFDEVNKDKTKEKDEINVEDMIISALITYCPREIIIQGQNNCKNQELINTIKNVFLERVVFV